MTLWSRLLQPESGSLSSKAARAILKLDFTEEDRARPHDLATRGQSGALTTEEEAALETCCHVGRLRDLMRSKARRSLAAAGPSRPGLRRRRGRDLPGTNADP